MKYFKLYELVDQRTYEEEGDAAWEHFTDEILFSLDGLREFFGRPVTVNNWMAGGHFQFRGFRPAWYQPGVTPGSQHRKGNAIDCDVAGMPANQARREIVENKDNPLLAKITRTEDGVNWIHLDCLVLPEGKERIYLFKA